jgi:hexosaminidase
MKFKTAGLLALIAAAGVSLLFIAMKAFAGAGDPPPLIPLPSNVESGKGEFPIRPESRILVDETTRSTGELLAAQLRKSTGYPLAVAIAADDQPGKGNILITRRSAKPSLAMEGYELTVTPESVVIRAPAPAGAFYGVQTLLQLLPPAVLANSVSKGQAWSVPSLHIEDQPRFPWRGFLLDVARHFFTKAEVKTVIDMMASQKLNVLQLHLTDDQGWRVEIRQYPRLTEVGAWRKGIGFKLDPKESTAYGPDGRYGGFYTREDIRELVAYAQTRHVTILPEIEMPGHASAALTAHPEFSCNGGPYNTDLDGGVFPGVYCAGNDATYEFAQNVLSEVIDLFPGKYIHIGGDEVDKQNWKRCAKCQERMRREGLKNEHELQSHFVRRLEKFISSKGRTLVGWSEIREGGLAQNAVVMDWIGGAVEAAGGGHDVVMTPTTHCYLDYYQSTNHSTEPRAIGGFVPLDKVYSFEPIPAGLDAKYHRHILGAQGNLWTEYIASLKHAQYMAFPRLSALAEVAWSPKSSRNYADFTRRLRTQFQRFEAQGVHYRKEVPAPME